MAHLTNGGTVMISTQFLLAGNSTFTVSNDGGEHYTFKVKKSKEKYLNGQYTFFISLLTGPDEYTYLGIIKNNSVALTKKSKYKFDSVPYRVAKWAVEKVMYEKLLPIGYDIQHAGKCGKCGRKLTTPESINTGLGPVCARSL